MIRLFLKYTQSKYLFKIDPDTQIFRKFNKLPDFSSIFGTVQHQKSLFSIQGGCIGFTRDVAEELFSTNYFLRPYFAKSKPIWAITKPLLNRPMLKGMTSFDWVIGWACRELNIRMIDWPEIRSEWKAITLPINAHRMYAVAHPYKLKCNMRVSVILSTRNRANSLKQVFDRLPISSFIKNNVDLVLIDNGSSDHTQDVMQSFRESVNFQVTCGVAPQEGISYARNLGIELAKGELLIFADDDCYMHESYIDELRLHFDFEKFQYCGGRIELWDETDAMESINYHNEFKFFPPKSFIPAGFLQGANMVIHRSIFDQIGGFNTEMGAGAKMRCEDIELLGRASLQGFSGAFLPQLLVFHHHRRKDVGVVSALRQANDIGRGSYYAAMCDQGFAGAWQEGIHLAMDAEPLYDERKYSRIINELEGALLYFRAKEPLLD
jgi:glycosyltransferase involved in cell wall biosynthesis